MGLFDLPKWLNLGSTSMPIVGISPDGKKAIPVQPTAAAMDEMMNARETVVQEELDKATIKRDEELAKQEKAKELEYNDPINQVNRLKAAGINPYFQNISAGEYGSAVATPSLIGMKANAEKKSLSDSVNETVGDLVSVVDLVTRTVSAISMIDDFNYNRETRPTKAELTRNRNQDYRLKQAELNARENASIPQSPIEKGMDALEAILDVALNLFQVGNSAKRLFSKPKKGGYKR